MIVCAYYTIPSYFPVSHLSLRFQETFTKNTPKKFEPRTLKLSFLYLLQK